MKQYIKYLLTAFVVTIIILQMAILCVWWIFTKTVDLHVDDSKHIAVFGNSMGECSINDTILPNFRNCCCSGMSYNMERGLLTSFLEQNPQIDTVFLSLGEFSYVLLNNKKDTLDLAYYNSFAGYVAYDGIRVFEQGGPREVISRFMSVFNLIKPHYGYLYLVRDNLHSGKQWSTDWFNDKYPTNVDSLSFDEDLKNKTRQLDAFNEIIEYCHKTNRVVVIYNPPTYQISNWIDDNNYNKFLLTLNNVLVADYTYFELPDDSYRGDVQHLNHKGAEYFCEYIKKNGWHLETSQQYYNRRNLKND
ncbi:MAG: hypothetical protein MJ002_05855 [Paludibacteraceae bacterium]|nr:hypothetical protein [Paludibacteraceae bacterium]